MPSGLINSIGLPNKGLAGYLEHDLPELAALPVPLITNVMGSTAAEVCALVEAIDARPEVAAHRAQRLVPERRRPGWISGADPRELGALVREVRPRTSKPLIVKLTPNTADVALVAQSAEAAGADAVSLHQHAAGLRTAPGRLGRAVARRRHGRPVGRGDPRGRAGAGRERVARRVDIPIVGMGGVSSGTHARQFLDAGATLVAVGTESFRDPAAGLRIRAELDEIARKERRSHALIRPKRP